MILPTLFIIINAVFPIVLGETGCPPPDIISPCKCSKSPSTRLECANITDLSVLKEVFKNSKNYLYKEVHIESCVVMYLPSEIFETATVYELYINNSKFNGLFASPSNNNLLYMLQIENVAVQIPINWNHLKNLTNLRTLRVFGTRVLEIESTFSKNLPKNLREIKFIGTQTQKIEKDAFSELSNLEMLVFSSSNLTNISRAIFPCPFNIKYVYFENSGIRTIPDDFFLDIPNLQFMSLKNNSLIELHEVAFKGKIPYINIEGNPLRCDCLLVWLLQKPQIFGGTCETPSRLRGKKIQNLSPGDFKC